MYSMYCYTIVLLKASDCQGFMVCVCNCEGDTLFAELNVCCTYVDY